MRSKDLACPGCGETRHTRLDQTTVTVSFDGKVEHSTYPVGYVVFACSCPVRIHPLVALVKSVGATLRAEIEAALAAQRERDAASNAQREAEKRQAAIAQAEAIIRAWATAPVGDRTVNRGTWQVRLPELDGAVALSDLDQAVQDLYAAAVAEAEVEVRRRDLEDVERLAKAQAEQPKLWADQAKREQAEARRRRAERSDVEVSNPT